MPYPTGAIAGWKCNDLVDYVSATHTLIGAGTSPFADNARSGTKSLGQLSGSNYFRNATARTALSGATTWGLSFRFYAASYGTGPQILSIGNTTGDNIVYRVLSTGALRAIINDSIFTDSAAGIVLADRWMAGGLEFTGGVLKAYAGLDSVTNTTPALSISNAAGDFPTNGSIWFGVAGTNPSFLPFVGGYIDDIVLLNTAPGSYPQVDTGPALTVGSATASTLTLTWVDEWALSYDVYRNTSNNSSTATKVGNVAAGVQSFIAAGLSAGTTYYFWLRPVYHTQNIGAFGSVGSGQTTAGSLPAQPTGLAVTASSSATANLSWTAGANTDFMAIRRATTNNIANSTVVGATAGSSFTARNLTPGTLYYWWAEPYSELGAGTAAGSVSATQPAAPSNDFQLAENDRQRSLITAIVTRLTTPPYAGTNPGTMLAELAELTGETLAWQNGDVPVWAGVPKDTAPPFITVAASEAVPWGTKSRPGNAFTVTVLVASWFAGFDECDRIADAILDALSAEPLDLSADGFQLVLFRPTQNQSGTLEADGRTNFRRMTYRAIVADAAQQDPHA